MGIKNASWNLEWLKHGNIKSTLTVAFVLEIWFLTVWWWMVILTFYFPCYFPLIGGKENVLWQVKTHLKYLIDFKLYLRKSEQCESWESLWIIILKFLFSEAISCSSDQKWQWQSFQAFLPLPISVSKKAQKVIIIRLCS